MPSRCYTPLVLGEFAFALLLRRQLNRHRFPLSKISKLTANGTSRSIYHRRPRSSPNPRFWIPSYFDIRGSTNIVYWRICLSDTTLRVHLSEGKALTRRMIGMWLWGCRWTLVGYGSRGELAGCQDIEKGNFSTIFRYRLCRIVCDSYRIPLVRVILEDKFRRSVSPSILGA